MNRKKDRIFVLCQILAAIFGGIMLALKQNDVFLGLYIVCMAASIPTMYFNYSLCKWGNRMHSAWNEKNPCDGEPSNYRIVLGKIGEWLVFILGLALVLLPSQLG